MAFFECEFPTSISFLAKGGPVFSTTVNEGFSGSEQRNQNWSLSRGEWTIDLAYKPQAYFELVQSFFLCVSGQCDAFRFQDVKDYQAVGQVIGYGDGTTTVFQLINTYFSGGRSYIRTIQKPVTANVMKFDGTYCAETVVIYVGNILMTLGTDYTVDQTTGLVTFTVAPASGSPPLPIIADFNFDYPVRFANDALVAQLEDGGSLISWTQIKLREDKLT
jgi:uncharacterized protein (TIGR02217 family)